MANGHGGYRKPSKPAAVSGPGVHSRRTDGQPMRDLPNADYGENATFRDLQRGAPLAGGGAPTAAPGAAPDPLAALTGLGAPTQVPGQPVTAGADAGPGPGMSALGLPMNPQDEARRDAQALLKYVPAMIIAQSSQDATPAFRRYVRRVLSQLQ